MKRYFYLLLLVAIICSNTSVLAKENVNGINRQNYVAGSDITAFLDRMDNQQQFEILSRIYKKGDNGTIPYVMYLIDQTNEHVYFINTELYKLHREFANALSLSKDKSKAFYQQNYSLDDRRFIMGSIAYQNDAKIYTFETWEGDRINEELLNKTYQLLSARFFAPIYFKPNSMYQEELLHTRDHVPYINNDDLSEAAQYQAIRYGKAVGKLRIAKENDEQFQKTDIVIFESVPVQIVPVSGIISSVPGSPLSHISMLSRGWKIPYATIRSAPQQYKDLDGKYVKFIAGENGYSITLASEPEIQALQKNILIHAKEVRAHANLDNTELADLSNQRKGDAEVFGAKSANLGELIHIHSSPFGVPPGFTIPFYYYDSFIKSNELHQFIAETLASEQFKQDSTYRDKQLEIIRDKIQNTELDHEFTTMLLDKVHKDFNQKGVFVRSSSNAEDLPNFSGAGLYSTVPNVKTDKQLIAAVKTVWASVWNKDAFEARENFGMDHFSVYPAVIIQEGMNADAAGVMVTTNPFNNADKSAVYINAKKGLGMKVVDGHNVPEQIMYHPRSQAINVITRSRESSMTIFNEDGGVKNVNIEPRQAVLSEKMIRKLVKAAQSIEKQFGYEQDIEWLFEGEQLYIVQSRPYIQDQ